MRKKFRNHADALKFGKEAANRLGVKVYAVTLYLPGGGTLDWVFTSAGNGGNFKSSWIGADCSDHSGWYFGGARSHPTEAEASLLLTLPEQSELPGKQEFWYATCAARTAGWSPEQLLLLARRCDATNNGVWHESWVLSKELNPNLKATCPCGPCHKREASK